MQIFLINESTNQNRIYKFDTPDFADKESFNINGLLSNLKQAEHCLELIDSMIFWLDYDMGYYVFLGNDPVPIDMFIYFNRKIDKKVFFYLKM